MNYYPFSGERDENVVVIYPEWLVRVKNIVTDRKTMASNLIQNYQRVVHQGTKVEHFVHH